MHIELNKQLAKVGVDLEQQIKPYIAQRHAVYAATVAAIKTIKVVDAATAKLANDWIIFVKIEAQNFGLVRAAGPGVLGSISRKLHAQFKPDADLLDEAEAHLKTQLGRYTLAQRAAQEANFKAAAASHAAGNHAQATAQIVAATTADTSTPDGTNVRGRWKVVSIDNDQLPREYMTADTKKIFEHARDTKPDVEPTPIPGVLFSLETITTVRTK